MVHWQVLGADVTPGYDAGANEEGRTGFAEKSREYLDLVVFSVHVAQLGRRL